MTQAVQANPAIHEEDKLRAELYDFLAALLAAPPTRPMLSHYGKLQGDDTELGKAFQVLAKLASATSEAAAEREFANLFIGVGRGELLPYASFYMTGFLNEKPLAVLRKDMARRSISRAPNVYEPEDNIASLCEMMAGLILGRFGDPASLEDQKAFFNTHIAPWAAHFFADLEGAKGSVLYAPVGTIGRVFIGIEKEAFRLSGS
ncbi:TorD/DmsD family molecular chaperone [Thalassovita aquimarina]|uniref:Molecular chaperone TorD family protein n=1 Tax=Thalassovita aquimarina TaxID=2785917 RepID=A0ABS5HKF5_9RHOB|nr:molecular chaperone TorD family protein [Thalassovita aquimarina]MBR9649516.1 molecular chaperone TorD family protein [Thalassovita aquimarina]